MLREVASILWRRVDRPGHEAARLFATATERRIEGTALFVHDEVPCRLEYQIACDLEWRTLRADVTGWVGNSPVDKRIRVENGWLLDGAACPAVADCTDVDLNFSPSTNLLPIRRLRLSVGQSASVRAAWLRFPSFKLEPLGQVYHRIDDVTYRYESAGGSFVALIRTGVSGFVTDYPGFWSAEALQ
jgi:uncharacterized protein